MHPDPLDIEHPEALVSYLRSTNRIDPAEEPRVQVLAGGVSNKTVRVERASGESWVIKQALAKLRVAVDWYSDPRRIAREALGLKYLAQIAPPGTITPLIFEDPSHLLLAMQAVPQPHDNWKNVLLAGQIDPAHIQQFAQLLATIHRRGHERRAELAQIFADRSVFESLRIEPYYLYAADQIPQAAKFLKDLVFETRLRQLTLVHGDYSPKNILIQNNHLILLDHEVIHFGDPAFDLGFSLTHFLAKGHHLPEQRRAFSVAARSYWRSYRETLGEMRWAHDLDAFALRHTLACLLARVAGRSPLEYLTPEQRDWQRTAALMMMSNVPASVDDLIQAFLDRE